MAKSPSCSTATFFFFSSPVLNVSNENSMVKERYKRAATRSHFDVNYLKICFIKENEDGQGSIERKKFFVSCLDLSLKMWEDNDEDESCHSIICRHIQGDAEKGKAIRNWAYPLLQQVFCLPSIIHSALFNHPDNNLQPRTPQSFQQTLTQMLSC
jgi:hypothetical protein